MTHARVEHVNITVANSRKTAAMLKDFFGWHIRWEGASAGGGWTVHVGENDTYLAVWSGSKDGDNGTMAHKKSRPMNHIGIVVSDLDAAEERIKAKGLRTFSHGDYEPGRRFYFFDPDGVEFEVISYAD